LGNSSGLSEPNVSSLTGNLSFYFQQQIYQNMQALKSNNLFRLYEEGKFLPNNQQNKHLGMQP
jgi:hypothetical protein